MFPVINGSVASHEKNIAMAKINQKGKIDVVSYKYKKNFWGVTLPFFRGIALLFFGIYVFITSLNKSQIILQGNKEDLEDKIAKKLKVRRDIVTLTICGLSGALIGFLGLILVPYFIFGVLVDDGINIGLVSLIIGLIRVGLLLIILLSLRFVPSMRQFYRNNAAGNLAQANYENKKVDNHHLSTNFLNFIISGFLLSLFVVSFMAVDINFFLRLLINTVLTILCFSLTYEFLKLFEFNNGLFTKLVVIPSSFLVTEKPTQTEREIAFTALNEVILMQENEERLIGEVKDAGIAFSVAYSEVKNRLADAGIEDIAETDWLIAESLGKNRSEIKLLTHISSEEYRKVKGALNKREKRMPLTKIFNRANFYGREYYVDKNVLSPRQETEQVVEEAIKIIKNKQNARVLDLMTGSGAIAITIAKETNAIVFASDISKQALEIAKNNAKNNDAKIKFIESDIFKNMKKEKFDLIISNPPYIPSADILTLDEEVKNYDPLISLDGGEDGLYFYREIIAKTSDFLKKEGVIVLEIGFNQGNSVKKLLQNSFKSIRIKKDYSGNDRIVIATIK